MAICVPKGYLLAGVHCRIKRDPQKQDLTLVMSETPASAAGVYTQNLVYAAPVALGPQPHAERSDSRRGDLLGRGQRLHRASGACATPRRWPGLAAAACAAEPDQALVLSTGVIGAFLPMDQIAQGIAAAAVKLGRSEPSLIAAARGMLTTDTIHKMAGRTVTIAGRDIQITGMAKGAAMMGPNMATMLALVMTDARLAAAAAQAALSAATEDSFNCMSVDGHMSTNDTVLLLANGAAGGEPLAGDDLAAFQAALDEVCVDLAKSIAGDGEGATHLITIEITGCADAAVGPGHRQDRGQQPAGKNGHPRGRSRTGDASSRRPAMPACRFDPSGVTLRLNGFLLYEKGSPVEFDGKAVSELDPRQPRHASRACSSAKAPPSAASGPPT